MVVSEVVIVFRNWTMDLLTSMRSVMKNEV
jgi:hypothetical protein